VKDPTSKTGNTRRRSLDEIEKILDEDAAFDEAAAAVEGTSEEALEREVAAAGIDIEKMKAKVLAGPPGAERPRRAAPVMSAWLVAAALALLVAGAMALAVASNDGVFGDQNVARPPPHDAGEDSE
jgi:hypothetical protein